MKKIFQLLTVLFVTLIFNACKPSQNETLIIGNWQAITWVNGSGASIQNTETTSFLFSNDNKYTYNNLGTTEKGTYKVENDMLFTTPENGTEMMVKIAKLTKDSLMFSMSRSGFQESITLIKK